MAPFLGRVLLPGVVRVVGDGGTESGEVVMDEAVHLVRHDECGA